MWQTHFAVLFIVRQQNKYKHLVFNQHVCTCQGKKHIYTGFSDKTVTFYPIHPAFIDLWRKFTWPFPANLSWRWRGGHKSPFRDISGCLLVNCMGREELSLYVCAWQRRWENQAWPVRHSCVVFLWEGGIRWSVLVLNGLMWQGGGGDDEGWEMTLLHSHVFLS